MNKFVAIFTLLTVGYASNSMAQNIKVDDAGCWWEDLECPTIIKKGKNGTETWLRIENSCPLGIYMKICFTRTGGRSNYCQSDWIAPGRATTFYGGYNNTGDHNQIWIGSKTQFATGVCMSRTSDWDRVR